MSMTINIEISDADLEHFQTAKRAAIAATGNRSEDEIVKAAADLLIEAQNTQVPEFIAQRLAQLDDMIAMLRDEGWALPPDDRQQVLSALVYFADPSDAIPDTVPVLGFLDDAIMIELCVRELRHELDAYDEFCDFRQREATRRNLEPARVGRAEWLEERRLELLERMHTRRERDFGVGYGRSSGYGSGRSYTDGWRPGIFRMR